MTNEYNPDGKEIRFIDSHYKDLFHIPDGSCVQIHYPDEMVVKPCTFIDEYHMLVLPKDYGCSVSHLTAIAHGKRYFFVLMLRSSSGQRQTVPR